MRCLLIIISLFLLSLPFAYGQQQYSVGACLLLDQQVQRFSHIPQSSNYRNAKREYDKNCLEPAKPATPARQSNTINRPAEKPQDSKGSQPAVVTTAPAESAQTEQAETEQAETAVAKPDLSEPGVARPESTEPETATQASPAIIAEQLLEIPANASEPNSAELQQPEAADARQATAARPASELTQRVPVIKAGDVAPPEPLLSQIINNFPLIVANIFAFLLAVFLLTNWLGFNLPGFKGVFAEYKLNRVLRWRFKRGYHHFRKLKLLTAKDELVVVDQLVLSPFGIFVIMVKNYRGRIFGSETGANWMRQYFGNSKQFMNPLHQNFKNVEAVKNLLQLRGTDLAQHVHSVVAFNRGVSQFKTDMPANVIYIHKITEYLQQFGDPCFDDEQLSRFSAMLSRASIEN